MWTAYLRFLFASTFAPLLAASSSIAQTSPAPKADAPSVTITPTASAAPKQSAHWAYEGKHGPSHWAMLSPAYAVCDEGRAQSPVDIRAAVVATASPWKLDYQQSALRIVHHENVTDLVDNGHTIQVTVEEGSTLTTSRNMYHLKQFHFHTPSEHTIEGKNAPMEVHFVHQSADKNFAVVAALFAEGAPNESIAKLIANFPKAKGESAHRPEIKLDLVLHLPAKNDAYTYMGSFTTPPCTENVEWFVFRNPVIASREQLNAFAARLSPNNRPVQALNDRTIDKLTVTGAGK